MGAAETPRGGRPTKLTPELRDQLLALLAAGELEQRLRVAGATAVSRDPEAWRTTAEILAANERAWSDLLNEGV